MKTTTYTIKTLLGIFLLLLMAYCPAASAEKMHVHSDYRMIQSEEEQVGGNSGAMNNLLQEAYIMEKKSDFKSAVSVYSLAIDLAKSQKDGLMENYLMRKKGGMFLFSGQMDSAHVYFFAVNQYARKNGIDSSLANVLVNQGYLADLEGDNNDCLLYYDSALVIYEKMKDTIGIASVMNNLALFYEDRGEYTKALEHALKNESLLIGKHDTIRYVAGLITLGNVYEKLKEYDTALAIYEESFRLSNEHNYPAYANTSLINRAVIYYRQGKLTESENEFQRAIEYAEKVGDKASLALLYNNIGIIYRNQDKYDLALKSYMKALQIAKEINDLARQVSINNNLGILYKNKKNYSEAIKYYNESLGLALKMQKKEDIRKTYGNLASLYEESGDFKAALSYLTLENIYQDSVINEEKVRAIEDMKAKYEREKNLAQIKALKNENKIKELEKKSIRTERNSAFGISATVVFLLILILMFFRMKSRKNMIIAAQKIQRLEDEKKLLAAQSVIVGQEKERKRIAQELHDGIGVLLSTASIHFSSVSKEAGDSKTIEMFDKAEQLLKQAGGEVRKISQNMMPVVLSKFGLLEALEDMFDKLNEMEELEVSSNIEGDEKRLPENTEIMLYRVIQEMVNNTLKHAKARSIEFSCRKENGTVLIDYKDDGVGFDMDNLPHNASLGIYGIQSRIDFLKGKLKVETAKGKGTYYQITLSV